MTAPTNGREANEQGFYERDCPFDEGQQREQWLSDWSDAQVDREAWEDDNWHRAHVVGSTS